MERGRVFCIGGQRVRAHVLRRGRLVALDEQARERPLGGRHPPLRGQEIAMISQDPATFLNPVMSVGRQLLDVIAEQTPGSPETLRTACELRHAALLADDLRHALELPHPPPWMAQRVRELESLVVQRCWWQPS